MKWSLPLLKRGGRRNYLSKCVYFLDSMEKIKSVDKQLFEVLANSLYVNLTGTSSFVLLAIPALTFAQERRKAVSPSISEMRSSTTSSTRTLALLPSRPRVSLALPTSLVRWED
jgi:hypothetical protein